MTLTTLLEVFPGWPTAAQGSIKDFALLWFIGPLALGGFLSVLFNASRWLGRDKARAEVARIEGPRS